MSTCISAAGEYSNHLHADSRRDRFVCQRCLQFDEEVVLAELFDAKAKIAAVDRLIAGQRYPNLIERCWWSGYSESQSSVRVEDVRAALRATETSS